MSTHEHSQTHDHGGHSHGHHGHSHGIEDVSDGVLLWAIIVNLGLSVFEFIAGLISGSVALMADALHNTNDAGALLIAYIARKISRKQADAQYTFGYRRAELIGAMIQLVALIVVGLYLVYEAIRRIFSPEPLEGGWIMAAAGGRLGCGCRHSLVALVDVEGQLECESSVYAQSHRCGSLGGGSPRWCRDLLAGLDLGRSSTHASHRRLHSLDVLGDAATNFFNFDGGHACILGPGCFKN